MLRTTLLVLVAALLLAAPIIALGDGDAGCCGADYDCEDCDCTGDCDDCTCYGECDCCDDCTSGGCDGGCCGVMNSGD